MSEQLQVEYVQPEIAEHALGHALTLRCDVCGALIAEDHGFTRRSVPATGRIQIVCEHCQPFRLVSLPIAPDRVHTVPLHHNG